MNLTSPGTIQLASVIQLRSRVILADLIFLTVTMAALVCPGFSQGQTRDAVEGNLIQFSDNGAWSWYMDERAVVDVAGGKIITGADASGRGLGGSPRNGAIDAILFDSETGLAQRSVLLATGTLGCDDHNAPAFLVRPDGKYLAQYAGHNANFLSYFRICSNGVWGPQTNFNWTSVGAVNGEQTSYSNPHYLSAENRIYSFVRCIDNRSPHILVSTNYGDSWSFYGKLVKPDGSVGYNSGYFRYSDNGVDRIDFICTEAHPRDILTSIYHGYISNGMSFMTDGTVVDSNLNDTNAPVSRNFTAVFTNGTVMPPGQTNYRCWNDDVQFYADGTIACIISSRINQSLSTGYPDTGVNPNHAFFFCRYDGTNWTPTYLCQAGLKLYAEEGDYVGLGCLNPNDPDTIYISTKYDPRAVQPGVTDTNLEYSAAREIWKGVTTNHGATFTWIPITQNSIRDNIRPIVPAWDVNHTAVLWSRGTYFTAQIYDMAVVGLVEHRWKAAGPMHYVDATTNNTMLTNGTALVLNAAAHRWHSQTGVGNDGTIMSSADSIAENASNLVTQVAVPGPGTYDLWVDFWGNPAADWRIKAGLSAAAAQTFRSAVSRQVQPGDHDTALVLTNLTPAANYLYQGYVGRVVVSNNLNVDVFVDDNAAIVANNANGTTMSGNTNRTWYDGISFAAVTPVQIHLNITYDHNTSSTTLTWNSISPLLSSLASVTYTVQRKDALDDPVWTTMATGVPSAGPATSFVDSSAGPDAAFYRITSP